MENMTKEQAISKLWEDLSAIRDKYFLEEYHPSYWKTKEGFEHESQVIGDVLDFLNEQPASGSVADTEYRFDFKWTDANGQHHKVLTNSLEDARIAIGLVEGAALKEISKTTLYQYHQTLIARYYNDEMSNETKIFLNRIIDEIGNILTGPDRMADQIQKPESQASTGPAPVNDALKEEPIPMDRVCFKSQEFYEQYLREKSEK